MVPTAAALFKLFQLSFFLIQSTSEPQVYRWADDMVQLAYEMQTVAQLFLSLSPVIFATYTNTVTHVLSIATYIDTCTKYFRRKIIVAFVELSQKLCAKKYH